MRERVARAICRAEGYDWPEDNPPMQEKWFKSADAAIEALTEPTEAMIRAGTAADMSNFYNEDGLDACFRAMMNRAREGK